MAGIYIHIPFCKKKCTYCDFHFSTNFSAYEERMIIAIRQELLLRKTDFQDEIIETIYFGGGTPSITQTKFIKLLLNSIYNTFKISTSLEVTLEANPDDISESKVLQWVESGVNRLSIGIQSFYDEDLLWMNRAHNAKESLASVEIAQRYGISNISIDLIYGLPEMDSEKWTKQLHKTIELDVQHISAYCLTVEEKTALNHLVKTKKIKPVSTDLQAEQFALMQSVLKDAGFIQYEVSNFGKKDFFSKHNSSYWRGEKYLGLGPSAHSYDGTFRSWNISNNLLYMKQIENGILPNEQEELTPKDRFNELLLTGLRTIWGVSLSQLSSFLPLNEYFNSTVKRLLANDDAIVENDNLILTDKGLLLADHIAAELFY